MTMVEGPARSNLIGRVQGMLMKPALEWDVIDAESATTQGLFKGYVCILAAITPIVSIIIGLFAVSMIGMFAWLAPMAHLGATAAVGVAVISYVQILVTTYVVGVVVDLLAPGFGGEASRIQGMKVASYAWTAAWVSGIALFIPVLGALVVLAAVIYSLYTFWIGAPKLMKVPAERSTSYALASIIAAIIVALVLGLVFGAIKATLFVGSMMGGGLF